MARDSLCGSGSSASGRVHLISHSTCLHLRAWGVLLDFHLCVMVHCTSARPLCLSHTRWIICWNGRRNDGDNYPNHWRAKHSFPFLHKHLHLVHCAHVCRVSKYAFAIWARSHHNQWRALSTPAEPIERLPTLKSEYSSIASS